MHVRKGDQVLVLSGVYKGKISRVLKVFPETQRVVVEGVNFIKRHTRPSQQNPQGGIIEKEAPIHASKVMVICPKCNRPTRVGRRTVWNERRQKNEHVRFCKKCGEMIVSNP
ncbi:MAG: 50S ribosomal protein L24 [candidate division KSB1 bacterium]|nr:50S ribosomal protein L24 [candidate division KSB1 bacterium]